MFKAFYWDLFVHLFPKIWIDLYSSIPKEWKIAIPRFLESPRNEIHRGIAIPSFSILCTDIGEKGRKVFKRGYYLRKYNNLFCQEPEARCATNECPKCFKDKLYEYGMVDSYRMKFNGSKSVDQCYSLNKCCVCFNLVNQNIQWMDLIVCTVSS